MYIDSREPDIIFEEARKYFDDFEIRKLEVGDIEKNNIILERKEIEDFCSSVISGRMQTQCLNMSANYEHRFVIIIGPFERVVKNQFINFSLDQFLGAIASVTTKYKCQCLWVENRSQFWKLTKKILEKSNEEVNIIAKRKKFNGDVRVGMLCAINGIGEKKARNILKQFTIHQLCHANVDDIRTVKGIGAKRARAIKEALK